MTEQRNLWPAVLVSSTILAAVIIWTGCKKQPSESATADSESPQSEQVGAPPVSQTGGFTRSKRNLQEVIDAARTWGPASDFKPWFGKPAPEFTLTDMSGKQHRLSDYQGKDVLLVFWATWCGPCRMEIPDLIKLRNTIGEDKLAMLAISYISPRNTTEIVKKFITQIKEINYTVFSVNSSDMPAPYNLVNSIPCSFFIDPEGKIKLATIGLLPLSDMKAILQTE